MSRLNLSDIEPQVEPAVEASTLDKLIVKYASDKAELKLLTEETDAANAEIKRRMREAKESVHEVDGWVATYTTSNRESMNEVRLLDILKKRKIPNVIKTKEYVDMDALEKYLYNNATSTEFMTELNSCKTSTEVITLRVTKKKAKKKETV